MDRKKYRTIATYTIVVGILLISVVFLFLRSREISGFVSNIMGVLSPFFIGFCIAYLLLGPQRFLEKQAGRIPYVRDWKPGLRRGICMVLVYAAFFGLISLLAMTILPTVIQTIATLIANLPTYMQQLTDTMGDVLVRLNIPMEEITQWFGSWENILTTLLNSLNTFTNSLVSILQEVTTVAMNLFMGLLISCYMLAGRNRFALQSQKALYALLPQKAADYIIDVAHRAHTVFSTYIYVRLATSAVLGVLTFLLLRLLGIPYDVLIGVVVAFCNLIPIFGPIVGTIIGAILLITVSPWQMLIFVVISIVTQQLEGNIITPKLMDKSIGLPAFWVLVAVTLGGGLWGMTGMLLGVPVMAVIYALFAQFVGKRLHKKGIEPGELAQHERVMEQPTQDESDLEH